MVGITFIHRVTVFVKNLYRYLRERSADCTYMGIVFYRIVHRKEECTARFGGTPGIKNPGVRKLSGKALFLLDCKGTCPDFNIPEFSHNPGECILHLGAQNLHGSRYGNEGGTVKSIQVQLDFLCEGETVLQNGGSTFIQRCAQHAQGEGMVERQGEKQALFLRYTNPFNCVGKNMVDGFV